jgi:hypothetical protein
VPEYGGSSRTGDRDVLTIGWKPDIDVVYDCPNIAHSIAKNQPFQDWHQLITT